MRICITSGGTDIPVCARYRTGRNACATQNSRCLGVSTLLLGHYPTVEAGIGAMGRLLPVAGFAGNAVGSRSGCLERVLLERIAATRLPVAVRRAIRAIGRRPVS